MAQTYNLYQEYVGVDQWEVIVRRAEKDDQKITRGIYVGFQPENIERILIKRHLFSKYYYRNKQGRMFEWMNRNVSSSFPPPFESNHSAIVTYKMQYLLRPYDYFLGN